MIGKARALREVAQKSHSHLEAWLGAERANALAAFIRDRLEDGRPTIMVYGIYNAGKSTLLNALAGEERAPVSNRPETSVVTPYYWRDFEILDTPGSTRLRSMRRFPESNWMSRTRSFSFWIRHPPSRKPAFMPSSQTF